LRTSASGKEKIITTFVIVLLVTTLAATVIPWATATPTTITSTTPESGHVGDIIRVVGEIDTTNGTYTIFFDEERVQNGTALDKVVNATFFAPHRPNDNYLVRLYDETTGYSDTRIFSLEPAYYIEAVVPSPPKQLQEGQSTEIRVNVTGGTENTCYVANITVTDPSNTVFFNASTQLTDTADTGDGWASALYPRDFGTSAHTNLTGVYRISFNNTLATGSFAVGLTDQLEYPRTETVSVQGSGYKADENVTVGILVAGVSVSGYPKNVTTDSGGLVVDFWEIPANVTPGMYTVTLTSVTGLGTLKTPVDAQNFTVLGAFCLIQAWNLGEPPEPVAGVAIVAREAKQPGVQVEATNETGWVEFALDFGNYTFEAQWTVVTSRYPEGNIVVVGSLRNQSITEMKVYEFNITCQLAHVNILVKDEADKPLPFVYITLTYSYTQLEGMPVSDEDLFVTDYRGTWNKLNTLTSISYTIEARRYGHLFYKTLIENLTVTRWINITCPTCTIFIHVLDSNEHPLQNVQVTVYEWSSERVMLSEATNETGNITSELTFGRYEITVSKYSADFNEVIVLNRTILDLIEYEDEEQFLVIHCKIFGIALSVKVVDYFGQPIPNTMVEIERRSEQKWMKIESSPKTDSEGIVSLPTIGGDYLISIYATGSLDETRTLSLTTSQQIVIKLDKYMLVGGYLIETSRFITYIPIILLVVVFCSSFIYKRYVKISAKKKMTPEEISK